MGADRYDPGVAGGYVKKNESDEDMVARMLRTAKRHAKTRESECIRRSCKEETAYYEKRLSEERERVAGLKRLAEELLERMREWDRRMSVQRVSGVEIRTLVHEATRVLVQL